MLDAPSLPPSDSTAYVALGANLGDARSVVAAAIRRLGALPETRLLRASSLYRTTPVGLLRQPDFVNAVAAIATRLTPEALLTALHTEEARQGRVRSIPNAPRTLDLDLLLYEDILRATPLLTLPHPRMHLRAFVLVPLAEIAPDLAIPTRGPLAAWLPAVAMQGVYRMD
ncbi:MAG: 2-amino-4-hydroxy-6-hydroxymethyldihydropteridine diphosphokinase [Zoogloeaceae bacterium]|nr:2-amino-4-hydroxy-6-hydroxymethyldihydropteridine diphosphokinase [Zoogloeaceae bacterium]